MAEKYVTAKISEVFPNPYRSSIGGGILHPEKLETIKASIKSNGVWDSWPVRRTKDGRLEMVGSTHRQKAVRDLFGKDHTLRFQLVDYDDAAMLRGMIDENLAGAESKNLPIREQADYVTTARDYLVAHPTSCTLTKKHEHGDMDCLQTFLGASWTVVRISTLLNVELLAPGLGVTSDLKPSCAERLVKFPKTAQLEIAKIAGEDLGKRQLLRLLKATESDRKVVGQSSGKEKDKAEAKLVEKVSRLAKQAVEQKKNPNIGLETVKVKFPKSMTKDEIILSFFSLISYDALQLSWKAQAAIYHPDRKGGDSTKASNLNELWARMRKLYGKDGVPGA
jgi:ParB-like chromosome segregation protein Spo0J